MAKVFPLEIYLRSFAFGDGAPVTLLQAPGPIKGRWAAPEIPEDGMELRLERPRGPTPDESLLQLDQSFHQGLGDITASERAEAPSFRLTVKDCRDTRISHHNLRP
jgi:hypothetical protein